MAPPHTRFKPSFHNRLSHLFRHVFNRVEPQHSSIEISISVHEDGPDSIDRPQNISVDGLNRGFNSPAKEPKIDRMGCTSSGNSFSNEPACSTISPFEAGNFAVGSQRHVKESHVARQAVAFTNTVIYETITYMSYEAPITTSTSPTPTSSSPTSSSTTSSANSSSQCNVVLALVLGCPLPTTTTPQTSPQQSPQQSPATSSSYTVYPSSSSSSSSSSPSDESTNAPTSDTPTITATTSLQTVLASATVSPSETVMVSSQLAQSTSVPNINSNTESPPHTAAIVGGTIGVIVLLGLLIFIAILYRRKRRQHSVTPFILPSTAGTAQIESAAWLKSQGMDDDVRPSNSDQLSIDHSDTCLVEYPCNRCPSFATDHVSSHLPNEDDIFASTRIARRQQANGLEKLYPCPSRTVTSDHYCRSSVENWVEQVVTEDASREPSEVLPEYRSTKSLRREKGKHNIHFVLPSSYPPLP
ncbi:hypothetical protein DEU56DRAFT_261013 [Suillus clintonianus]|uniref:uncharacterized protein n=1 Tax=Suillus clintonianus TaxID=1904413 RepID=UPI001B8835F4|nr:uncharacterized protein DEU56DRAFT_261013 [Suillus clintonianus]KAG2142387.1 hypothetical protein DEU56DRAFT_261013 [Suillus clintonianus]